MAGNSVEEIKKTRKEFLKVAGGLAVLTVITVWISYYDFGVDKNMTFGLLIASLKASLVALSFMHLKAEKTWIYLFLLLSAVMFLVCMFLTIMQLWDPISTDRSVFGGVAGEVQK